MKLIIAAAVLSLFAVASRAADAPAPADNTKKCEELRAKYDKDMKHMLLKFGAHHHLEQMKKLGCTNMPPEVTKK